MSLETVGWLCGFGLMTIVLLLAAIKYSGRHHQVTEYLLDDRESEDE